MQCEFATSVSGYVRADIKHPADIAFERFVGALEYKRRTFDFATMTREGACVFVGEGDLSFAYALAKCPKSQPRNLIATTYESVSGVCSAGRANARALQKVGATVLHGVDARCLNDERLPARANLIAFQFPNTGTRRSVHGRTDNHILIRRFLASAAARLKRGGLITITVVNSPHHLGAFDLPGAAKWAACRVEDVFPFFRSAWPGYGHVNTNDPKESALSKYRSTSTWVFRPLGR